MAEVTPDQTLREARDAYDAEIAEARAELDQATARAAAAYRARVTRAQEAFRAALERQPAPEMTAALERLLARWQRDAKPQPDDTDEHRAERRQLDDCARDLAAILTDPHAPGMEEF